MAQNIIFLCLYFSYIKYSNRTIGMNTITLYYSTKQNRNASCLYNAKLIQTQFYCPNFSWIVTITEILEMYFYMYIPHSQFFNKVHFAYVIPFSNCYSFPRLILSLKKFYSDLFHGHFVQFHFPIPKTVCV